MSATLPEPAGWEAAFAVGIECIDTQHRRLLALCDALALRAAQADDAASAAAFDAEFESLKRLVHEHFNSEAQCLAAGGAEMLEDHADELAEFDYLAAEVATTAHFERQELQRFLGLWCLGHVTGSVRALQALQAAPAGPA